MKGNDMQTNEEVKKHLSMLRPEEFEQLEQNIMKEGCRDPLVLWNDTLIDGHNRLKICLKYGISFDTVPLEFEGIEDVLDWVDRNQLGRRNLTKDQFTLSLGRIYNRRKKAHGGDRASGKNYHLKTSEVIGQEFGVSEKTVRNAGEKAAAIDHAAPELIEKVQQGEVSVSAAAIASTLPEEAQMEIVSDIDDGVKPTEAIKKHVHVAQNSGQNEWYTPPEYIESARAVMDGITLDPASSDIANKTVQADSYYTKDDDGLKQQWAGNVWMNPPYAAPLISQFTSKICESFNNGELDNAIILINNATETAWFQRMAAIATAICFPSRRIKFNDPEGNPGAPLQGQAIVYMGNEIESFHREFSGYGFVATI